MEIELTRGKVAVIDDADAGLLIGYNWEARKLHGVWYACGRVSRKVSQSRPRVNMHHLILGKNPGAQIDHRDGDGLNNRRDNLRPATHSQNQANQRRLRSDNTSGFKGVVKAQGKWHARIWHQGKRINIGTFATAELAAAAYDNTAREVFGEFAATNLDNSRQRAQGPGP